MGVEERGESTELGIAYRDTLKGKYSGEVAVFDYVEDFDRFWSEADVDGKGVMPAPHIVAEANESSWKALIIIWDSMPTDGQTSDKLLEKHLTPMDWVLAFTMRMIELELSSHVNFSIHIIDLTCQDYVDTHAMRVRGSLLDEIPWVTLHAPIIPPDARFRRRYFPLVDLIMDGDDHALIGKSMTMAKAVSGRESGVKAALQYIANLWRATVLQSNDHHDLNNVIGPQIIARILSGVEVESGKSSLLNAFMNRLDWTGLLPSESNDDGYKISPIEQSVDLVVIDDQLDKGWNKVLGALVGIPQENIRRAGEELAILGDDGDLRLYGATKPHALLEALGITVEDSGLIGIEAGLYSQRNFDSPVSSIGETRPWVLVLDIRLFSGEISAEREWYAILAATALEISETCEGKLAWDGFDEVEQLEYIAGDLSLDKDQVNIALSLLPRLCALRWPSVPIIIFSSTGRRELITKLAEYGNIFLSSTKPNVLAGNPEEQLDTFIEGWSRDVQQANSLLDVQRQLLDLVKRCNDDPSESLDGTGHTHVVIAFEESGNFISVDESSVGGAILFASGASKNDAILAAKKFQEMIRRNGVSFYDRAPYYTDAGCAGVGLDVEPLRKNSSIRKLLNQSLKERESSNVRLSMFRCAIPKSNYSDQNVYADGSYLRGLSVCIELIFYELLNSPKKENLSYSVWFATKQTSYDAQYYAEAAQQAYLDAFNLEKNNNKSDAEARWHGRQAYEAKKKEKLTTAIKDKAVDDAMCVAARYDFRHTIPSRSDVETIGGRGKAYTLMLQVLGRRSNYETIIKSVSSLKSRKIPYATAPEVKPHNDSMCAGCGRLIDQGATRCRTNSCKGPLVADYSVMSHLADAVLSEDHREIGTDNLNACLSFDVVDSDVLADFLYVGRLMDAGRKDDAFKLAFERKFFEYGVNRSGSFAKARIEQRLVGELKRYVTSVSGLNIMELTRLPIRGVRPRPVSSGQHKRVPEPKVKGQEKSHKGRTEKQKYSEKEQARGFLNGAKITEELERRVLSLLSNIDNVVVKREPKKMYKKTGPEKYRITIQTSVADIDSVEKALLGLDEIKSEEIRFTWASQGTA